MTYSLTNFERHIEHIKALFNQLSQIISLQSERVFHLLCVQEDTLLPLIETSEKEIDDLEVKIRTEVVNAIVLYTPRAVDSRKMFAYIDITGYLERIGDLLLNIARYYYGKDPKDPQCAELHEQVLFMLEKASEMVSDGVISFAVADPFLARQIIDRDEIVDEAFINLVQKIPLELDKAGDKQRSIPMALLYNSIGYCVERIADNATNIAESVIFFTEGKNVRHISKA